MKKLLSILTLCMGLCCVSCYDDSALVERIDALEKNAIASINEQISAIKGSITSLEAVDVELKSTIKALEAKDATLQGDIDALKEADASLETKIGELKTYVDDEISNTEDWATATFATIEKYNEIVNELSALKEIVESNYSTLDKKIDDSIESIKTWVNEALKGYYTSVEVDELLKSLKDDLDALQAKLDNLLRDFTITFDDTEIGILAGGSTSVGYTITGATEKTIVKALGQNGWSAKVTPDGTDKGKITVTAPDPLTEDEIIVLVYDGEFRTIMSSINFVTGVATPSQTAVELEAEAGTVEITVTSNLNYKVSIPDEAKEWLSVVETKAAKTDTITFAYTENEFSIRRADVLFIDEVDNTITKISFIQQGAATEVTLTKAGTLLETIGEELCQNIKSLIINGPINGTDVIWLKRMNNLSHLDLSNASIVEGGNSYSDGDYTKNNIITHLMFHGMWNLTSILLPDTISSIESFAFYGSQISKIDLPDNITTIGSNAFSGCTKLESVKLPENLEEIGENAFARCGLLKSITIPQNVKKIASYSFTVCYKIEEIHIKALPSTLSNVGFQIFESQVHKAATLYIPSGTKQEYILTEFGEFVNIIEE